MKREHFIHLENLSLNYPILSAENNSLKGYLRKAASLTKSKIGNTEHGTKYVQGLKGISLHIEEGDRLGLLGNNGAGKTSLLKTLAGIYLPTSGDCIINGQVSSLLDMGLGLDEDATGLENIFLAGYLRGRSKKQTEKLLPDITDFTELGEFLYLPVRTYSAGMRTRLAFSIATAIVPDILLIDEVIGTGDDNFIKKSKKRMENIMSQASILVFASHNNALVKDYCNKGAVLQNGEIVFYGSTDDAIEYHKSNNL